LTRRSTGYAALYLKRYQGRILRSMSETGRGCENRRRVPTWRQVLLERWFYPLNRNPLDLIARDIVAGTVIKLGRARAFMRRHRLGVFEGAAGLKISGDPRGAEGMAADPGTRAEVGGAALDHAISVDGFIGLSVSVPVRPTADRKRGALPASRMPAASR
jgi:hypothetical protein